MVYKNATRETLRFSHFRVYASIILFVLCFQLPLLSQNDSSRLLPSADIIAKRLDFFTIGQTQLQSDSTTLALFKNQNLAQLLQAETPLSIKTYGTGLTSLSMRGLPSNSSAILWNGINLQNPLNGGMDLTIIETGAVQKIGVKLGGCSSTCGSGAIGGVISLNNQKPQKEGFHGQFSYGLGSFDWQSKSLTLDYAKNKIGASVMVSGQSATNNFLFRNTAEIGQPLMNATHAAYNFLNMTANFYAQLSSKDYLKTHFWRSENYREITPTMTARSDNAIYRDTANRISSEWTHFFKKSFLKIQGAYLFDKNFYQSDVVKNSQNGIHSYIGEAEWNYHFSEKHLLRVGLNAISDRSENNNYKENKRRDRLAFFINDAFETKFLTFTGNIRQEWIDADFMPTTFSVGAEKHFGSLKHPKNDWILRGSLSRNFNIPTFNDLYWPNLGNPNLVNELGWSKELGISFKHEKDDNKAEAHLTLFDIDIKNRIAWLPQSDGQWRPTNLHSVTSQGIETRINYADSWAKWSYKLNFTYQFAHATDRKGGVQLFTPRHNGAFSATARFKKIYLFWQQTASSRRYGTTDKTTWTNPFTIANATLGYTPSVLKRTNRGFDLDVDMRLRIENVFNTDYQIIRYYPIARRLLRLEVSAIF